MYDSYNAKVKNFIAVSVTQLKKRITSFTYLLAWWGHGYRPFYYKTPFYH